MEILIINATALSKLNALQLLYPMFSLDHQFYSSAELKSHLNPETSRVYSDLVNNGLIKELNYTGDEMNDIYRLCKQFPYLSTFESISLYFAKREDAALFATHKLVRAAAAKLGIAVYGYNWVFDQFSLQNVFPPMDLFTKWKSLEKLFYSSTDSTLPDCVKLYYRVKSLKV